jgi:hypothetical protein
VAKRQPGVRRPGQSRLDQIVAWLGAGFDGCVVFDECHKSKNLIPTAGGVASRTGTASHERQRHSDTAQYIPLGW